MSEQASRAPFEEYTPRQRLAAMLIRAELDPEGYGMELRNNPERALRSVGLSDAETRSLISSERAAEPGATLRGACFDTTCGLSFCPETCFVSIPAIPGVCNNCTFFSL
jgi:hypothetical protein